MEAMKTTEGVFFFQWFLELSPSKPHRSHALFSKNEFHFHFFFPSGSAIIRHQQGKTPIDLLTR
jgi:hypothetical protein